MRSIVSPVQKDRKQYGREAADFEWRRFFVVLIRKNEGKGTTKREARALDSLYLRRPTPDVRADRNAGRGTRHSGSRRAADGIASSKTCPLSETTICPLHLGTDRFFSHFCLRGIFFSTRCRDSAAVGRYAGCGQESGIYNSNNSFCGSAR